MEIKKRRKVQRTKRYPKQHVPDLVARARDEETSGKFPFIDEMTREEARDELLMRFSKFTDNLIKVVITGKVNTFLEYQVSFIKLWKRDTTDCSAIGQALKREIGDKYPHEELYRIGDIARVEALARTRSNYATTILSVLKDALYPLSKGQNNHLTSSLNESMLAAKDEDSDFRVQLSFLEEDERNQILAYLDYLDRGEIDAKEEACELSPDLVEKLKAIYSDFS